MKKLTGTLLALLLVCMLFSGCMASSSPALTSVATADPTAEAANTAAETSEPATVPALDILWGVNSQGTGTGPVADGITVKAIEDKFNVKLTFFPCDSIFNSEQWNIKVSSGEVPDVWYDNGWTKWYQQGLVKPITEQMVSENMPWSYNNIFMKEDPNKISFKARTLDDGTLIGIPSITLDGNSCFLRIYRQDWLDAVGLKVPTTLDELEIVAKAFTENDPDKNGKKDTYGINLEADTSVEFGDVFGAFGVEPNLWLVGNDGKLVYSNVTDGYKQALKVIASWYKAGYINPEFQTDSWDQFVAKFVGGTFGSYMLNWRWASTAFDDTPVSLLVKSNPNVSIVTGDALKGPDGKSGAFGYGPDLGWAVVFKHDLADDTIVRCMQIIDWLQYDEGVIFNIGGSENLTYKLDQYGAIKSLLTPEGQVKQGIGVFPFWTNETNGVLKRGNGSPVSMFFNQGVNQPWIGSAIGVSSLTKTAAANIGTDLGTIYKSFFADAVTGKIDIDQQWDAYVKSAYDSGLTEQTAEANEIYQKNFSK